MALISAKGLSFTYTGSARPALDGIDLEIEEGDFLGIIGPSGAGKSTLAYCLNGIVPHYTQGDYYGHVTVAGTDTFSAQLTDLSRTIATVFQDIDSQMVSSIVEDEVLFGLENFGVPHAEIPGRIQEALERVGILDLHDREISSLSGGQKQKVALAAMIALKPRVLLLDEPTGELDPVSSRQIFELLRQLNQEEGTTIVVIEQKIMLLSEFARTMAVLDQGTLHRHGPTREVLAHVDELKEFGINVPRVTTLTKRLKDAGREVGLCITIPEAADALEPLLPEHPAERPTDHAATAEGGNPANSAAASIEFKNVSFSYSQGEEQAAGLHDLSFTIEPGSFVSLIGTNGAGKTTVSKLMNGLLKPTEGAVLIDGIPTTQLRSSEIARSVGMLFQNPDRQICQNTCRDELAFSLKVLGSSKTEAKERADELCREFGFDPEEAPYMMSRGERQRLALASTLIAEPDILILDEPTTGLDHRECMQIMDHIGRLNREKGTTVIMVCHDMELVRDCSHHVLVLSDGHLLGNAEPSRIFNDQGLMAQANILPPQIIGLSHELKRRQPNHAELEDIQTYDQMVAYITAPTEGQNR